MGALVWACLHSSVLVACLPLVAWASVSLSLRMRGIQFILGTSRLCTSSDAQDVVAPTGQSLVAAASPSRSPVTAGLCLGFCGGLLLLPRFLRAG